MFVGWALGGLGAVLLWAAIRNENPWQAAADVVRGEDTDAPLVAEGSTSNAGDPLVENAGNDPGRAPVPRAPGPGGVQP